MKDCTTCKYGYEDERLGIPMCHHPKRFSDDCVDSDFRMYEEKEIKESEKPTAGLEKELERFIASGKSVTVDDYGTYKVSYNDFKKVARHFAKWGVEEGKRLMMEEFEGNRLAACTNQTKEEYDREIDFALEIINKEHRQPTFSDAINYGMQLQKNQMENDSIECLVCAGMEGYKWIMTYIGNYESMLKTCKAGDKVRVIVIPNTDEK